MMAADNDRIQEVLDRIRPALQMDGGDCQLVDWDQDAGVVKIHFVGACGGCPMSTMTLKQGIERALKQYVPGVETVEAV
ncbi:MAG: NifU family protein [Candidatus Thermoplasmatota archaeon]|nr:NifU family protein [Candidatus Thermoplasmatota archaeon]